ncbi:type I DNA topoisomerase [Phyllobacterium sp. P30BS-XVII]|uniref:type I DNA topoisomerase n=1 Tax=Phyllobacterium sp. P30BS-XVII TaxID=2587046 RepID=UPI0015FB6059|nr:DNA topoisomerase-1 [Phyllobacterium sp. P30BS-XVII]
MKLLIIESPGKVKKLSAILGDEYEIVASIGHVRDLPTNEIAVSAPDFRPKYVLSERGAAVIERIKRRITFADEVLLATDPDREGESIGWHLKEVLGLVSPKRVTFNSITREAVLSAVLAPHSIDVRLVAAQEARRVLDRLVGYLVSPEISNRHGEKLSAGRVQSVAVRILVEREREIKHFRKTIHYGAELIFDKATKPWSAKWMLKPDFVKDDATYFMDQSYAESVARCTHVRVLSCQSGETRRAPYPPFITSTLQQAASVLLGLNPENTMAAAQALYEQGFITYHRTDNPNIADEDMPLIRLEAEKIGLETTVQQRRWPAKEGAQTGHPGVTPTHWDMLAAGETEPQRLLYQMIRLRSIASQLVDARYAVRVATLSSRAADGRSLKFEARGRVLTDPGWLKLKSASADDEETDGEEDNDEDNPVPDLSVGSEIAVSQGKLTTSETKPAKRYTEASLIKKLESEGIGRPSTYAAIMSTIIKRDYAKVRQKMLIPTEKGCTVVDILAGRFGFMDLDFTRKVEAELDLIASGRQLYKPTVAAFYQKLQAELLALTQSMPAKPSKNMVLAVQSKARREGLSVPDGVLASAVACRHFLGPMENHDAQRSRPASDKQIALLQKYIDAGKVAAPKGFPENLSAVDASNAIETVIKQAKRK